MPHLSVELLRDIRPSVLFWARCTRKFALRAGLRPTPAPSAAKLSFSAVKLYTTAHVRHRLRSLSCDPKSAYMLHLTKATRAGAAPIRLPAAPGVVPPDQPPPAAPMRPSVVARPRLETRRSPAGTATRMAFRRWPDGRRHACLRLVSNAAWGARLLARRPAYRRGPVSKHQRAHPAVLGTRTDRPLQRCVPPLLGSCHPGTLGQPANGLWPDLAPRLTGILQRTQASFEERLLLATRRNGVENPESVRCTPSPVFDESGAAAGLLCVLIPEPLQPRTHETLREGEAHFRLLAHAVPHIVWVASPGRRPGVCQPPVERLHRNPVRSRHAGALVEGFLHSDDTAAAQQAFSQAQNSGRCLSTRVPPARCRRHLPPLRVLRRTLPPSRHR